MREIADYTLGTLIVLGHMVWLSLYSHRDQG